MYARLNPTELVLPPSAQLRDGTWVSNYDLLPDDVLRAEGWKPLREIIPEYDAGTQMLVPGEPIDAGDEIIVTYTVAEQAEPYENP